MENKGIEQPSTEAQKELNRIVEDHKDEVLLRGKHIKMAFMRNGTIRKWTDIMHSDSTDELQVSSKLAAAARLNSYWKIRLFWGFLWRWYYYIREYSEAELSPLLDMAKKKVQVQEYFLNTILATAMKDTMMSMTRAEAERSLQGLRSGQLMPQERSDNG